MFCATFIFQTRSSATEQNLTYNHSFFSRKLHTIQLNIFYIKRRLCPRNYYLDNFSIAALILLTVSSLPIISIISVAPPGVMRFPETAVRTGHITNPGL